MLEKAFTLTRYIPSNIPNPQKRINLLKAKYFIKCPDLLNLPKTSINKILFFLVIFPI